MFVASQSDTCMRPFFEKVCSMVSLARIATLVEEVAAELKLPAKVVAATPGGDDRSYVEVIMTVAGCAEEPCRLMVGLHRSGSIEQLRNAIAETLREHPRLHDQNLHM